MAVSLNLFDADGPAQGGAVQAEGVEQATRGASPVGQGGVYGRSRARHSSGSARLDHLAAVCGGRARLFVMCRRSPGKKPVRIAHPIANGGIQTYSEVQAADF